MKIEGSGSASGSISQRHGSADPDPDPHRNVMDPQHCLLIVSVATVTLINSAPPLYNVRRWTDLGQHSAYEFFKIFSSHFMNFLTKNGFMHYLYMLTRELWNIVCVVVIILLSMNDNCMLFYCHFKIISADAFNISLLTPL
jgi:hypothetical protein